MSIWNKVLLALIFLASLAMLALGARALKTHQYWRELAARHEAAIAEQQLRARLLRGTATKQEIEEARKKGELPPNLRELEIQVHSALLARGPAWYGCIPQRVDPQSGQVTLLMESPQHQLAEKTVLWVFDERPLGQGGQFLGLFTVQGIGGEENRQVQIAPAVFMEPSELQRLVQSSAGQATWAFYQWMPPDTHEAFADLTADQLTALFPAGAFPNESVRQRVIAERLTHEKRISVDEAKRQGLRGVVAAVDESGQVVFEDGLPKALDSGEGIFLRELRDYERLIHSYHQERTEMADRLVVATRTKNYLAAISADAARQQLFRQRDVDRFRAEKAEQISQRDLVADYLKRLEARLEELRAQAQELVYQNQQRAAEIARIQLEAIRAIEKRVRQVATTETR